MMNFLNIFRDWPNCSPYRIFLILFFIFLGCDEGTFSTTGEGGSVEFQISGSEIDDQRATRTLSSLFPDEYQANPSTPIQWPDITQMNCDISVPSEVNVIIYNQQNIQHGSGVWPIEDGTGRINGVVPGLNNTIVMLGKSDLCGIVYRNAKSGIDIVAGQITNAGPINIYQYRFVPLSSNMYYKNFTLGWNSVHGAFSYKVQITSLNDVDFNLPLIDEIVSETNFPLIPIPDPLVQYAGYLWRVQACDIYGNCGSWSNIIGVQPL